MNSVEIYFNDLRTDKQKELLRAADIKEPGEANWDINCVPLTIISFESEV